MEDKLIELIENSIKKNWDRKAFTDFNGESLQYKDVARKIAKMHLLFEAADIRPGDKIALCGRNSGNWCVAFLATITYGAVIVPILHEFKPDNVHHIVNHSEARLLFVGDQVWENLNENRMPALQGIICVKDFTLVNSRSEKLSFAREHLNALFGQRFPMMFLREHVHFTPESSPEQLAVINYTSGTTGFSKGVMLPYRSLVSNVLFCNRTIGIAPGDNIVSMLPMGHVFGLVYDFLYGVCFGAHLYFLTRMPSPKVIMTTVAEFHPRIMSCVPLVIEKIFKKEVLPKIDSKLGKLLLHIPIISEKIKEKARTESLRLFGGEHQGSHHRRRTVQRRGGSVRAFHQFPLFHRLRHDGMRPHHLPQPVARNGLYVVRKGGRRHGTESAEFRPGTDSRRTGMPRTQHHAGLL